MSTQSVGIREFRDKLATYLLTADKPLAITRHGDTIGFYLPVRRKRTQVEKNQMQRTAAALHQDLVSKNLTEEDILRGYKSWKRRGRK